MGRRQLLAALGLGTGGAALGLLSGCSDDSGAPAASGARRSTTTSTAPAAPARPYDPAQPYWLQGNFAPVTTEETITELTVRGQLPEELTGLFVRNGSNSASGPALHWFLGDGMVHGVRLEGGRAAWYRNRWVATPIQQARAGLLDFGGIPGAENNQSNVSVIHHGGRLLSLGEIGWPYELSTEDLSTIGAHDYDGRLGTSMTAHPKIDPDTGRLHFFGYDLLRPQITYYAAAPDGTLDVVSPIDVGIATMVHDFAVTDRDVVFWIGPVVFGPDAANPNAQIPFHWDPDGPCRIGVMPLDGSGADIRWVDIPPCFAFHGLNAHRAGDEVVLRVHRVEEAFGPRGDLLPSYLTEWRVDTSGESLSVTELRIHDRPMDLPSHDRRRTGRATDHGWFVTTTDVDSEYGFELAGICHLDLDKGTEDLWDPGPNLRGGEPYYVPRSADAAEGDGWVMTFVWDRTTDLSSLAVFDAQDVAAGPVAEVQLPVRVPFGFHGTWIPDV